MSSQAYVDRLARALESTNLVEVVTKSFRENNIRVLCRVRKDAEPKWVELVTKMLLATEAEEEHAHAWQSHFCRHYFLREDAAGLKKLVFGWNISIQANDMANSLDFLSRVIHGEEPGVTSKKRFGEVTEMPLTGVSGERNSGKKGKGAWSVGGPEAFKGPHGGGR